MAELFANIEVNKDNWWPKLGKLLGGSVGLHLLLLMAVMYVPGLRDAFNIAVLLADTSFVEKDYEQTLIGEDIQMVEIAGGQIPLSRWLLGRRRTTGGHAVSNS